MSSTSRTRSLPRPIVFIRCGWRGICFGDGFVVMNSDVFFHPQLLRDLLTAKYEDAILVSWRNQTKYGDEEMKVKVRGGQLLDISKTMDPEEADGENVGIVKFGAAGARCTGERVGKADCRWREEKLGATSFSGVFQDPALTRGEHSRFPLDRNRFPRRSAARAGRNPAANSASIRRSPMTLPQAYLTLTPKIVR